MLKGLDCLPCVQKLREPVLHSLEEQKHQVASKSSLPVLRRSSLRRQEMFFFSVLYNGRMTDKRFKLTHAD